jgi:hypothetical protein
MRSGKRHVDGRALRPPFFLSEAAPIKFIRRHLVVINSINVQTSLRSVAVTTKNAVTIVSYDCK